MRPEILFDLFKPIDTLPGVGPRTSKAFEKLAGGHVVDLCWHLPSSLIDRSYTPHVAEAPYGKVATVTVQVGEHVAPRGPKSPWRIRCFDESSAIELVFFHAKKDYLQKILPVGATRVVSGRIEEFQGLPQITHPDRVVPPEEAATVAGVEPVYPLTQGLTQNLVRKAVQGALKLAPELPNWLDPAFRSRQDWQAWRPALLAAHAPEREGDLEPLAPARQRLAYDEILANQLALALVRRSQRKTKGRATKGDGHLRQQAIAALPFALTGSQDRAIAEVLDDMAADGRMLRLLQGDVGSGKTVVALLAMLTAVEAGGQAALMAPTEILARQHHATIQPLAQAAGLETVLLTGRDKGKGRKEALARLPEPWPSARMRCSSRTWSSPTCGWR